MGVARRRGRRRSIGYARLERDVRTGAVDVVTPAPGAVLASRRMLAITGTDVEGPYDIQLGPGADRPVLAFDPVARRFAAGYLHAVDRSESWWRPIFQFSFDGASWGPPRDPIEPFVPRPAGGSPPNLYAWGGHWPARSRAGFFGDYTALAVASGRVFFAWPSSTGSTDDVPLIDVWGADITWRGR